MIGREWDVECGLLPDSSIIVGPTPNIRAWLVSSWPRDQRLEIRDTVCRVLGRSVSLKVPRYFQVCDYLLRISPTPASSPFTKGYSGKGGEKEKKRKSSHT